MKRAKDKVLWVTPEDHLRIKAAAAKNGMTIKEYIRHLGKVDERAEQTKRGYRGVF